jgi:hypothetical protein
MDKVKVHESVLVGYFCQAVGWVTRDLKSKHFPLETPEQRFLRAINLSHNPLDPAIGDMILQLDDENALPKEFYIFEFKVDWEKGVRDEHEKFSKKNRGAGLTSEFVSDLKREFPEAGHAHFYGALAKTETNRSTLCVCPYWDAMLWSRKSMSNVLYKLADVAEGTAGEGLSLERLAEYMEFLNDQANSGSMAAKGSIRFAVAYQDYQLYTFNLDSILQYQLDKQRRLDLLADRDADESRGSSFSP